MSAPCDEADAIAEKLTPVLRRLVRAEVNKLRVPAPPARICRLDADMMRACRRVATACDALEQAKFAGLREVAARRELEKAAKALERVMRKQGRLP